MATIYKTRNKTDYLVDLRNCWHNHFTCFFHHMNNTYCRQNSVPCSVYFFSLNNTSNKFSERNFLPHGRNQVETRCTCLPSYERDCMSLLKPIVSVLPPTGGTVCGWCAIATRRSRSPSRYRRICRPALRSTGGVASLSRRPSCQRVSSWRTRKVTPSSLARTSCCWNACSRWSCLLVVLLFLHLIECWKLKWFFQVLLEQEVKRGLYSE